MSVDRKIDIKKPTLDDIPGLLSLWRGQYDYHHDLDSTYYVPNSNDLDKKFQLYLTEAVVNNRPHILIATSEDKIVGFVTYEKVEADYFDTSIVEHGDVLELYIDDRYRKYGIGNKLMSKVENFFKGEGLEFMSLQCSTYNKNALDFYSKSGYINRQSLLYKKI